MSHYPPYKFSVGNDIHAKISIFDSVLIDELERICDYYLNFAKQDLKINSGL